MMHVRYKSALFCLWLFVLALAPVQVVHAQGTATATRYFGKNLSTLNDLPTPYYSAALACQSSADDYNSRATGGYSASVSSVVGLTCNIQYKLNGVNSSTYSYSMTSNTGAVALPCPPSGTSEILDVTLGYSVNANDGYDYAGVTQKTPGQTICAVGNGATCAGTVGNVVMQWVSPTPTTQGLYRHAAGITVVFDGTACTANSTDSALTDANATPPTCPGVTGTVNGKVVCVPTSTSTRNAIQATPVPTKVGNPPAGSNDGASLASRYPTSGNNANGGSPSSALDGTSVSWGSGIPATAGTSGGSGSGSGLTSADLQTIKTDCDKYPNSVGCSQFGTPDSGVTLSHTDSGFSSITPASFATGAGCPAALSFSVMGRTYAVSYQPLCDNATSYIRPVVLVLGAALAAFIFVAGFRS